MDLEERLKYESGRYFETTRYIGYREKLQNILKGKGDPFLTEEEARQTIEDFYYAFQKIEPDDYHVRCGVLAWGMNFLYSMFHIREALIRKDYSEANYRISETLHREPFLQRRIYHNILDILENSFFGRGERKMDDKKIEPLTPMEHGEVEVTGSMDEYLNFTGAMRYIRIFTSDESDSERNQLLDFLMHVIRNDLKYDLLTDIIYRGERKSKDLGHPIFPIKVYDKSNNPIYFNEGVGLKEVNLSEDVVVYPTHQCRLAQSVLRLSNEEFEVHEKNHHALHYPELGITFAYNGLHSISAGVGLEKGKIEAHIMSVEKLFDHLYTDDGVYWYNSHTGEILMTELDGTGEKVPVKDFRIALLFEMAKMKHETKKNQK